MSGTHYEKTSLAWVNKMDANKDSIMKIFLKTYGDDAKLWFQRGEYFSCRAKNYLVITTDQSGVFLTTDLTKDRFIMIILIFFFTLVPVAIFQTFFLHRIHHIKCLRCRLFGRKPFPSYLFISRVFLLHPAAYGVMHRNHHSHADTPKDPHSPVHLTNIISFNLSTVNEYRKLVNEFMNGQRTSNDYLGGLY